MSEVDLNKLSAVRTYTEIDWEKCCFCQIVKEEDLRHPYKQTRFHSAYNSLETNLLKFHELDDVPMDIHINTLNDGSGIANTMLSHKAKYHHTCKLEFSTSRLDRKEAAKRSHDHQGSSLVSPVKKTRSTFSASFSKTEPECILCEQNVTDSAEELHKASSDNIDEKFKDYAKITNNYSLTAKLETARDMSAMDAWYHINCYTKLKNEARTVIRSNESSMETEDVHDPLVVAQIVAYMEEYHEDIYKLRELRQVYRDRLAQLGKPCNEDWIPHHSRFKDHLLQLLPQWSAHMDGRHIYISHKDTVSSTIAKAATNVEIGDDEARKIIEVGMLMRKYILEVQNPFTGTFSSKCLSEPVAIPLLTLIDTMLQGTASIMNNAEIEYQYEQNQDDVDIDARMKVACTLSQLICSNAVKRRRKNTVVAVYHSRERETPFPLYVGLKLHAETRLRNVVAKFHTLGLCVSYNRIMEVRKKLALSVCHRYDNDGVVIPSNMKLNVFTTADVDNHDVKKSCNLSRDEFHGTSITMTNHLSQEDMGDERPPITFDDDVITNNHVKLPNYYTVVHPVDLNNDYILAPVPAARPIQDQVHRAAVKDVAWLKHVSDVVSQGELVNLPASWSGYHSHIQDEQDVKPRSVIGICPLFPEKAATASMMKHTMEITKKGIEFINPGQTPVLGADQPLYALCKQLQWSFPDTLGEDKFVLMMGGLHIEMALQSAMGKLLAGSGWDKVLATSDVLTSGRASSALSDSHVKRTRYAHQVSLAALHLLKLEAYENYSDDFGPSEPFDIWDARMSSNAATYQYWDQVFALELLSCRFVRAQREGDFPLYIQVLDEMCKWFFALDRTNYARWLPIHIKDMVELPVKHPEVYEQFMKGNFVVQRSEAKFSLMAKDQSHEQSNKLLKSDGGPSGLFDNTESLAINELSSIEVLRIVDEFEQVVKSSNISRKHHEEDKHFQRQFIEDVKKFKHEINEKGNPFLESQDELVALDTREVMPPEVVQNLKDSQTIGTDAHVEYVQGRLIAANVPVTDTIHRKNIFTFDNRPSEKGKNNSKLGTVKQNSHLITKLFLSLQSRPDSNLDDFFKYENQREPPSLTDHGNLRIGTKSNILQCLPGIPAIRKSPAAKLATLQVFDMAAVVHMVKPTRATTLEEYTPLHLIPFLQAQFSEHVKRVDAVWDTYPENSLKNEAQRKRGQGNKTRVTQTTPIPKDWQKFLKHRENKINLFGLLSESLAQSQIDKCLVTTKGDAILTNEEIDVEDLMPCNHAEADSRILLHVAHGSRQGHQKAFIRTVDSDIVVLAISFFPQLDLEELWVGFGSGRSYKDLPVHDICAQLGPEKAGALPLFHALSGCDTTSQMYGIGKKTAWAAWECYPDITDTLKLLMDNPELLTIDSIHMQRLERLTVVMYSKGCGESRVNEARTQLFAHGLRSLEDIPPTQAALFQHVKRALLQAAFIWNQSLSCHQDIPDPSDWGWLLNDKKEWIPFWTTLANASEACAVLLHCGCTKACRGNCKCCRAGLKCTSLCKCEGGCINNDT